ncbi:helicase, partial [Actinotignum timonense]|nr:helicase [Actinotignum timonense]
GLLGRLADRVRVEELTVSYRTPAVILDTAGAVQRAAGVKVRPVRAARTEGGAVEIAERCAPGTLGAGAIAATAQVCQRLDARYGQAGTLGVIVPEARVAQVAAAIGAAPELGEWTVDVTGRDVTARIQVLTAVQSKGLEFDAVVLLEPAEILAEGPGNIYVAMTRPTQLLSVVSEGELPAGLTASAADTGV